MADEKTSKSPIAAPVKERKRSASPKKNAPKPKPLPPYHVVLLNDDDHTYDYVIGMLGDLFQHPPEKAFALAKTVDTEGRVIVLTTHKELAELKRDQILGYGADVLLASSKGSMSALIEPAPN